MNVMYIHGFASAGETVKPKTIREFYPHMTVFSPTLPIVPQEAAHLLEKLIKSEGITHVIGTSLGGFYSLYLAATLGIKCLMINPVLDPSKQMHVFLGTNKNVVTEEEFEWKKEHLHQLAKMEEAIENADKEWADYYLAIGKNDELLDPNSAINYFLYKSVVKIYDDDHRFWKSFPIMIKDDEFKLFFQGGEK